MLSGAVPIAEIWRGPLAESEHAGHVVVAGPDGGTIAALGAPGTVVLPRSSAKMIQALPLVMSGAADEAALTDRHLALACASHEGAPLHVGAVADWLSGLGLSEADLRCGTQPSRDKELKLEMIRRGEAPSQLHNNCSGKHAGFLTLNRRLGGGSEYQEPDHPVQKAALDAFEEATGASSPGFGIDGCSAPNFAASMEGMARAMSVFATAHTRDDTFSRAAARLVQAMISHPVEVAGEGRACTLLMQAAQEPAALKFGAEGFFVAILPERGLGIAVKVADGATRAAESAIAAVLVGLGVLDERHPDVQRFMAPEIVNRRGLVTGEIRPAPALAQLGAKSARA
ncbi:L-asparaginase II [Roseivivax halodurans JCM 10272]|uniref:L-asparaginase II n=1 Tax=Roseivivax halodurans JCM 10272 TaxID=1449350 RepID=X7ELH2_9RHOB|nr:asparaginase [Roseivivax halodurans]ETX15993.1 L-asparaginase II [Roseivivax halodurans JCM 10272]